MSNNYAIIDLQTNIIVNVIVWNGETSWSSDQGFLAIPIPSDSLAGIGWTYINNNFVDPNPPIEIV